MIHRTVYLKNPDVLLFTNIDLVQHTEQVGNNNTDDVHIPYSDKVLLCH